MIGLFPAVAGAQFDLPELWKRQKPIPTAAERKAQNDRAAVYFEKGQEAYNRGSGGKALSYYRRIVKECPASKAAPEALFRVGEINRTEGNALAAYKAYNQLVTDYPQSARFAVSIQHQYDLAVICMEQKKGRFIVVPRKISREKVVKMFQGIIDVAPHSKYASLSQFQIGEIHENGKKRSLAIEAYQKVVDTYPKSKVAPEAQLRVARIMEKVGDRYRDRDPARLAAQREAYEDFITNYPEHKDSEQALSLIGTITRQEAKKSIGIGRYYESKNNLKAAAIYYRDATGVDDESIKKEAQQLLDKVAARDPEAVKLAEIKANKPEPPPGGSMTGTPPNSASLKEVLPALDAGKKKKSKRGFLSRLGLGPKKAKAKPEKP